MLEAVGYIEQGNSEWLLRSWIVSSWKNDLCHCVALSCKVDMEYVYVFLFSSFTSLPPPPTHERPGERREREGEKEREHTLVQTVVPLQ